MQFRDLMGLMFSSGPTLVEYVKSRFPQAHILRDCCNPEWVHAWERYSDFADNFPGITMRIKEI